VRLVGPLAAENTWTVAPGPAIRPVALLQLALIVLAVSNLGRIPFLNLGDRQTPLALNDLAAVAVVAAGALTAMRARSLILSDAALAACAFSAIGALSAISAMPRFGLSAFEVVASLAYLARWVVYFGIYVVVINTVRERDISPIWRALEMGMLAFVAFGVVQSIFLPDFGLMMHPEARPYYDIDPQGHRLVSTVLEPNIAAAMILIVLLVQIAQLACGVRVPLWKPALTMLGLVLTISRSGALGFLFGLLLIVAVRGLRTRMLRFGVLAAVIGAATIPFLWSFILQHSRFGVTDGSAAARIITWQRAIATFWDNRWFGIGFNTYGFVQEHRGFERLGGASYSAEGGLLFVAVMTGIIGLLAYGAMLWYVLRKSRAVWRNAHATPDQRGLAVGAAAATVAICVHSVFVNSLLTQFVMEPLWVLWGLVFVVDRMLRHEPIPARAA
jgi:hypothetical protein